MSTHYDSPLVPGDCVARLHPNGHVAQVYEVTGYSPRGKLVMRGPSGGTRSAWWGTWLPDGYVRLARVPEAA